MTEVVGTPNYPYSMLDTVVSGCLRLFGLNVFQHCLVGEVGRHNIVQTVFQKSDTDCILYEHRKACWIGYNWVSSEGLGKRKLYSNIRAKP